MLRMGFIEDVEKVLAATPATRQVALFSATLPEPIRRIAVTYQKDPVEIEVEGTALSADHIEQRWMLVPGRHKVDAVVRLLEVLDHGSMLVFARTRIACAGVAEALCERGFSADALHGDLSQAAREAVLGRFRSGRVEVLVATDVAARGIDVEGITHVVNLDLPPDIESYVHRIGRTARAGREGMAISFVMPAERFKIRSLERALGKPVVQMPVPREADVARTQRERLKREIVAKHPAEHGAAWLEALREQTGLSDAELAAAALSLLAADRRIELAPPAPPVEVTSPDETHLFLAIGRRHGVRPSDVVGALANERGVAGPDVGRVTILERKSFVGLPNAIAERLLAEDRPLPIRGVEVRLARARGVVPRA
jgi:ATP-dependent RNA helicase DeaD